MKTLCLAACRLPRQVILHDRQEEHQVTQGHVTHHQGGHPQLQIGQLMELLGITGRLWPLRQQVTHLEQGGGPDHQGEGESGVTRRERQAQQLDEGQVDDAGHQHGDPEQHRHQQQGGVLAHGEVAGQRQARRGGQDGDGWLGGGGVGDLAIRYGYQRFRPDIMLITVIILIVLVQMVQFVGNRLAARLNKK